MQLSGFADLVVELQDEYFADDLEPPAGAELWSAADLRSFYESGGEQHGRPQQAPAALAQRLPWDAAPCDAPLSAHSLEGAHGSKAGQGLTRVRLVPDPANQSSAPRVLTSSWDATAKLWRLPAREAAAGARPLLDCLMEDPTSSRWVYDAVHFWYGGADGGPRLAVATSHTGGMMGEPEEVLRLWHLSPSESIPTPSASASWTARTKFFLNTQGVAAALGGGGGGGGGGGVLHAHRRGVHAVDTNPAGSHLASISDDKLVLWALDAASGFGAEAARVESPLAGSATRLRFLRDGETVVCTGPCRGEGAADERGPPV
eukprot:997573-Prymnesium_polylepis.1